MIKSFPFEGVFTGYDENGNPTSDRDYNAADLARYVSDIKLDGIIERGSNAMIVTAAGGLNVQINYGSIHIKGRNACIYDEPEYLTLEPGDRQPRIDLISMRLNLSNDVRAIRPVIIRGVPSASPVMPNLTRDAIIYDMILAKVQVPAETYGLTQGNITDTRADKNVCGMFNWSIESKGEPGGVAGLDSNGKVPLGSLPDASAAAKGIVQLATQAEAEAGKVNNKAVAPDVLMSSVGRKFGGIFGGVRGLGLTPNTQFQTSNYHTDDKVIAYNGYYDLNDDTYLYRSTATTYNDNFAFDTSGNKLVTYRATATNLNASARSATITIYRNRVTDNIAESVIGSSTLTLSSMPTNITNIEVSPGINSQNPNELYLFIGHTHTRTSDNLSMSSPWGALVKYTISTNTFTIVNNAILRSSDYTTNNRRIWAANNSRILLQAYISHYVPSVTYSGYSTLVLAPDSNVPITPPSISNSTSWGGVYPPYCIDYNEGIFSNTFIGTASAAPAAAAMSIRKMMENTAGFALWVSSPTSVKITKNYIYMYASDTLFKQRWN